VQVVSGDEGCSGAKEGNSVASPFGLRLGLRQSGSACGAACSLGRSTPTSELAGGPDLPQAGMGCAVGAWGGGALRTGSQAYVVCG